MKSLTNPVIPKTVWVIEQGLYSDYHVVGVFSQKEAAEQILFLVNKSGPSDRAVIVEWPMNPGVEEINQGLRQYHVCMFDNGFTETCELADKYESDVGLRIAPAAGEYDSICGTVWAKDQKHAVKIANEFRTQAIAENRIRRRTI